VLGTDFDAEIHSQPKSLLFLENLKQASDKYLHFSKN